MRTPGRDVLRGILAIGIVLATLATHVRSAGADDKPAPAPAPAPFGPGRPPRPLPPFVLSTIDGDPLGIATKLHLEAEAALTGSTGGAPDPVRAAEIWMKLVEHDDAALLPVSQSPWDFAPATLEEGLLWPASEVALTRLARLDQRGRDVVEARWGPAAATALPAAVARAGRLDADLEAIAARYPVTAAGATALLLVADRRLEAGRDAEAARHLWRWLRLRVAPVEAPDRVAAVVARLFDVLVRLEDARGVAALSRVCVLIPGAGVDVNGVRRPVEELPARAMTAVRARIASRDPERAGDRPPAKPTLLWSLDASDPNLAGGRGVSTGRPTARAAVDGDALYLVEARRVRRVDRWTGLVRWTYPRAEDLPRDFDPAERSRPQEAPVRDVVAAGGLVLAVLGSPPVSGTATFRHDGAVVHGARLARETRTRIVALDATDGHPVWWSGRLGEVDPVVGAADVAITSPLLVDGDSVSAVVAARRGSVECWLATFDLATGRVRRTTPLARAESGLALPSSLGAARTLEERMIRGLPRAERPVRAGDEIVVATGAGFVAGVGAASGRLRWVQALPRYTTPKATDSDERAGDAPVALGGDSAFSDSNQPVNGFGAWFVAAEDARFAVALEAGTGRLRWVGSGSRDVDSDDAESPLSFVRAQHLVGTLTDRGGRAGIAFAGGARALEARDAASGQLVRSAGADEWDSAVPEPGRPIRSGRSLLAVRGGRFHVLDGADDPFGPWRRRDGAPAVPAAAVPAEGDLVRAGDAWIVVGTERIVAIADLAATLAAAGAPGRDVVDRAARACLLARVAPSRASLAAAVAASASVPSVRAQLLPHAVDALLPLPEGVASVVDAPSLASLLSLVDALDDSDRARTYRRLAIELERRHRDARIVELLDAWLPFGDRAWVDVYPGGSMRVRSDLFASDKLPVAAGRSAPGRAALERRELAAESALARARGLGEAALVEAIRLAGGTRAAWLARFDLLAHRIDAGRFADAAATAADLRTSAPDFEGPELASIRVDPGRAAIHALRALEADLLARAGAPTAAREALFDGDRDGPALARTLDGGPPAPLAARLGRRTAGSAPEFEEEARLELFSGDHAPSEQARRDTVVLEATGLGPSTDVDRVVVARGLDLEIRSLSTGAVVAVAPIDAAFLGAVLQDRETAIPGPGVRVASVVAGGAADRSGLRSGDWLLRWGAREVADRASLLRDVASAPIGTPVEVEILRGVERLVVLVRPNRRSTEDRSPATAKSAAYVGEGVAIVASRLGLSRLDLATGVATSIWRSRHPGDVVESLGFAGTQYVVIETSPLGDTTVAAVDPSTGAERWATRIEGSTSAPPRVVGSALVVDTSEPSRTSILDRESGSLRASYARSVTLDDTVRRSAHAPTPQSSIDSGGAIWLWRDGVQSSFLSSIDPASGMTRFSHLPVVAGGLLPRPLAGGGLVAAAAATDTLEIFLPDLRGGVEPFGTLRIDGPRFGTESAGGLDFLSRIAVGGDSVYVARVTGAKRAVIGAVEIDRRALRGLAPGDPVIWHPGEALLRPASSPTSSRSENWPIFSSVRASLDGVWACATYWDVGREGAAGASIWFAPEREDGFASVRTESSLLYARGPVFVGSRVLVPTDGGYVVLRRRSATR